MKHLEDETKNRSEVRRIERCHKNGKRIILNGRDGMKVVTLMDNVACSPDFVAEFGLSYYIETERHRILFDSGSTRLFAENAKRLGIDLSTVDIAILSHGHFDHGGGLMHFLSVNSKAKVYVARDAFEEYFNAQNEYIGLSSELAQSDQIIFVDEGTDIDDGVSIVRPGREDEAYALKHPIEAYGLKVYRNGSVVEDDFSHELYLVLKAPIEKSGCGKESENAPEASQSETSQSKAAQPKAAQPEEKTIVFSGCSHRGILNIMSWFEPDVLFGGFHLFRVDTYGEGAEKLRAIAEELLRYRAMYYTCHCTGVSQYEFLSSLMEDRIRYLAAGDIVEL